MISSEQEGKQQSYPFFLPANDCHENTVCEWLALTPGYQSQNVVRCVVPLLRHLCLTDPCKKEFLDEGQLFQMFLFRLISDSRYSEHIHTGKGSLASQISKEQY